MHEAINLCRKWPYYVTVNLKHFISIVCKSNDLRSLGARLHLEVAAAVDNDFQLRIGRMFNTRWNGFLLCANLFNVNGQRMESQP